MIFISHRGNINNINESLENKPRYIDNALDLGYHVEIDLWKVEDKLYLGHDNPTYSINEFFLDNEKLYVHCKNADALEFMVKNSLSCNYFWHQSDNFTITSNKKIWVHVGKPLIEKSICCLPEQYKNEPNLNVCYGICSDYIEKYSNKYH